MRFTFEKKTVILLILTAGLIGVTVLTSIRLTQKDSPESSVAPVTTKATSKTYTKYIAVKKGDTTTQDESTIEPEPTEQIDNQMSVGGSEEDNLSPTEAVLAQAETETPTPSPEDNDISNEESVTSVQEEPLSTESAQIPNAGTTYYFFIIIGIAFVIVVFSFLY